MARIAKPCEATKLFDAARHSQARHPGSKSLSLTTVTALELKLSGWELADAQR